MRSAVRFLTPVGQDRLILTRSGSGAPELQRSLLPESYQDMKHPRLIAQYRIPDALKNFNRIFKLLRGGDVKRDAEILHRYIG